MKIAVGVPSRGRPLDLAASILSLEKTRSGHHEVQYIVGHDHGDTETMEIASRLLARGVNVKSSFGPRPLGLGEINNRLIAAADKEAAFLLWTDRSVIIAPHWDHDLASGVMQFPNRVLWLDSIHLVGPAQYILPPAWRAALPGPANPAIFPFWFDDSAVEEVDALVHGFPRVALTSKCAGPRTDKTTRMRELAFWIGVFAATRPDRVREARWVSAELGIPPRDIAPIMAHFEERDRQFLARADALMAQWSAGGEPDETYIAAKENAIALLARLEAERTI
ncbi:MAG TPA: glycosyltransferase [Verrucomicrobiae bacterium]|nr:glycosyltransferase [Verrucomicrobiae bacterium]